MTPQSFLLIVWVLLLGVIRVAGEKGQVFQAIAHLTVGGLAVAWWFTGGRPWRGLYFWLAVGLTVLEVACFVLLR